MTDIIILHHYDTSPYSEKVRLGLGLKGLAWASVEIPVIMPKPDLTALTGGYRKTPVLQIGADIYCDSQLIMRELERRHPSPGFYPAGRGAADALAWWAEKTMFSPAVGIAFAKRPDALPDGFLEDRAKFSGRNIDPAAMMAALPYLFDQLRAHLHWLDQMMADGRSFLQGAAAGLADLAAYHPIWFLQRNFGPAAAPLGGFPRLLSWAERVAAIGHGDRRPMTSQAALAVASAARHPPAPSPTATTRSVASRGSASPSHRTIPAAIRSSANWWPQASMRSPSSVTTPLLARSLCIFHVPALPSRQPSLTVSAAVAGRFAGGGKEAARSRYGAVAEFVDAGAVPR
jgi:glutathione S-transferase